MDPRQAQAPVVRRAPTALSNKVLSECDREKLHLLGNIQGRAGHVMFVSYPEWRVVAADASVRSIPWIQDSKPPSPPPSSPQTVRTAPEEMEVDLEDSSKPLHELHKGTYDLLGSSLSDWIPADLSAAMHTEVAEMIQVKSKRVFHFYEYENNSYAITLFSTDDGYASLGIEVELVDENESRGNFYNSLISLSRVMESYADEKVLKTACDAIFKILGKFDRGMVYKFNDDNSGEVLYEVKRETCANSSYFGMRFPSADIPLAARQLFIKNGVRYIQDVHAEDIPILHVDDGKVDLTNCRMRAVSKPHVMYLRNMGVDSSMSIAIVVENRLWGLLAFHGYTGPFKPSLHQRIACETINSMLSVKMESLIKKAQSVRIIELSETLMRWEQAESVADNLQKCGNDILGVLHADILVAKIQDPTKEEVETIVIGDQSLAPGDKFWKALEQQSNQQLFACTTREEMKDLGLEESECPAAGVIYFKDALVQVMLGRNLRSKDVVWGGNPDEPKKRVDGFLSPRKSFEQFMERAKLEAEAWSKADLHVISAFKDRVVENSNMRMMSHLKQDIEQANLKYLDAYERIRDNSSWFAHMSHEIRTPFHGVMGCLNILQESGYDMPREEAKDMVDTALQSGNHMIKLLNDILDIAKNKYLSHSIDTVRTSYQTLATEATQGLRSLAFSNNIHFNCEVLPNNEKSVIVTDKTKVVQIVSNLLNNAIKFSHGGSVAVKFQLLESRQVCIDTWSKDVEPYDGTIFTMQEHEMFSSVEEVKSKVEAQTDVVGEHTKWVLVSVSDSGCGMKSQELADMLKPYTQSSSGSNKVFQGTGLGLFICTSLTRQLQGFLACSSTPNEGTVFHVGIPVGVGSADMEDLQPQNASQNEASVQSKAIVMSGPIAVCDDNKVNVKILQRSLKTELKKRGLEIEVLPAFGGEEVVQLFKKQRPSLLFIDYHMPEVDGIEATRRIRQHEKENDLEPSYILSYTADATDDAANNILARGTDEIMTKPPPKGFLSDFVGRLQMRG